MAGGFRNFLGGAVDRLIPGQNYNPQTGYSINGRQLALGGASFLAGLIGGPVAGQAAKFAANKYENHLANRQAQQIQPEMIARPNMRVDIGNIAPQGWFNQMQQAQMSPQQQQPQPQAQPQALPNLGTPNLFAGGSLGGWASGGGTQSGRQSAMPGIQGGRIANSNIIDIYRRWSNR